MKIRTLEKENNVNFQVLYNMNIETYLKRKGLPSLAKAFSIVKRKQNKNLIRTAI